MNVPMLSGIFFINLFVIISPRSEAIFILSFFVVNDVSSHLLHSVNRCSTKSFKTDPHDREPF